MNAKVKTSIIIVYYKKEKEIINCLTSIYKFPLKQKFEIIVVDNTNDSKFYFRLKAKFPKINYLASDKNIGYGAGNNLGAKSATGQYLLIVNADTEFIDTSLNNLVYFFDRDKKAIIVGPNLVHRNGVVFSQLGSRTLTPIRAIFALTILNKILPNNPIAKNYFMYNRNIDELREVDVVPGSGLLIRKSIFNKVKGFDENFFLYFEESDLAKRIKDKFPKAKFFINPAAQIIHDWRPKDPGTKESQRIFAASRFYYFRKHYGIIWALVVEFFARLNKFHIAFVSGIILLGCLILFLL